MYHILFKWNIIYIKIMKIFKLFLLSFILITPVKANTIYNLIKIPNLEIYELKTPNNLKYFYAEKPFVLGVQKNISCSNSDKQTYDEKYQIISKNLNDTGHFPNCTARLDRLLTVHFFWRRPHRTGSRRATAPGSSRAAAS